MCVHWRKSKAPFRVYSRPALPGDQIRNGDFGNDDIAESVDGSGVQGGAMKLLVKIAMVVLAMTTLLIVLVTMLNDHVIMLIMCVMITLTKMRVVMVVRIHVDGNASNYEGSVKGDDDGDAIRQLGGLEEQGGAQHDHALLSSGKVCDEVCRK